MYNFNRLLCGSPPVVFVAPHTWLKTNAAMNLRAAWSRPPAVMFPVVPFIGGTEGSDLPFLTEDDLDSYDFFLEINLHT